MRRTRTQSWPRRSGDSVFYSCRKNESFFGKTTGLWAWKTGLARIFIPVFAFCVPELLRWKKPAPAGGFPQRGGRIPREIRSARDFCGLRGGAGSGNRTRMASLEGWNFTIKLCPPVRIPWIRESESATGIVHGALLGRAVSGGKSGVVGDGIPVWHFPGNTMVGWRIPLRC